MVKRWVLKAWTRTNLAWFLLSASREDVNKMAGIDSQKKQSSSAPDRGSKTEGESRTPRVEGIDSWRTHCYAVKEDQNTLTKVAPLFDPEMLNKQNKEALEGSVNLSAVGKFAQYEVHKHLHWVYETKQLMKTTLTKFLEHVEANQILKWLGISLAPVGCSPS